MFPGQRVTPITALFSSKKVCVPPTLCVARVAQHEPGCDDGNGVRVLMDGGVGGAVFV